MRAAVIPAYKSNFRVQNVVEPTQETLGAHDLKLRIFYAGYNPIDWKIRNGFFQKFISIKSFKPSKENAPLGSSTSQKSSSYMILGTDFVGEIIELGSSVVGFTLGDIVCGFHKYGKNHIGTFAEEAIVRDDEALRVPDGMNLNFAGSVGLCGLTAFQCLEKIANNRNRDSLRDKSVVIIGASGGVGSIACLLAKHFFGATVYGVCSIENANYLLNDLGIDEVIDYNQISLDDYMKKKPKSEKERVVGVIDLIGTDEYRHDCFSFLGKGTDKKYVTTVIPENDKGVSWGKMFSHSASNLVKNTLSVVKGSCTATTMKVHPDIKQFTELLNFLNESKLWKKVQVREYPLDEIQQADEESSTGKVRGKLAIHIGDPSLLTSH